MSPIPPQLIETVAKALIKVPLNKAMSAPIELRYGTHGSLSVDTQKGVWCDHEAGTSGGILDLIERETNLTGDARWGKLTELTGYQREKPAAKRGGKAGKIVATYDYADAAGGAAVPGVPTGAQGLPAAPAERHGLDVEHQGC